MLRSLAYLILFTGNALGESGVRSFLTCEPPRTPSAKTFYVTVEIFEDTNLLSNTGAPTFALVTVEEPHTLAPKIQTFFVPPAEFRLEETPLRFHWLKLGWALPCVLARCQSLLHSAFALPLSGVSRDNPSLLDTLDI